MGKLNIYLEKDQLKAKYYHKNKKKLNQPFSVEHSHGIKRLNILRKRELQEIIMTENNFHFLWEN